MTPEEAYEQALRPIRKAEQTGALELDLSGLQFHHVLAMILHCRPHGSGNPARLPGAWYRILNRGTESIV